MKAGQREKTTKRKAPMIGRTTKEAKAKHPMSFLDQSFATQRQTKWDMERWQPQLDGQWQWFGTNHLAIHGEDAKVKAGQREKTAKRKAPKIGTTTKEAKVKHSIVSMVLGTLPYHWNSLTRRRFFF